MNGKRETDERTMSASKGEALWIYTRPVQRPFIYLGGGEGSAHQASSVLGVVFEGGGVEEGSGRKVGGEMERREREKWMGREKASRRHRRMAIWRVLCSATL